MNILIGTPFPDSHQLMQNRQYQVFSNPTKIYPVVMAYAATIAHNLGHNVRFNTEHSIEWADLILWEVKTPVIKKVWSLINNYKRMYPDKIFVLCGDHVTALPTETLEACDVDYLIIGGNYDKGLSDIISIIPDHRHNTEKCIFSYVNPINDLPIINRCITNWRDYAYQNGNFKYLPGTYTMFARDCWWRKDGGCTFCSWTTLYPKYQVMSVNSAIKEVMSASNHYGAREIFDDSGTFPRGGWMHEFCEQVIKHKECGLIKRDLRLGCNLRPGGLNADEYHLLKKAGFRFVLFGMESSNFETLQHINKGQKPGDMAQSARMAKQAGLEPHVTIMLGYPWEGEKEIEATVREAREMFKEGIIDTLQATIVIPYPGTKLFDEADRKGWLLTKDWEKYDMSQPVLKTVCQESINKYVRNIYESCITPKYLVKKVLSIRTLEDFQFLWRCAKYVLSHRKDFSTTK